MTNMKTAKALGAAALGISALVASTALAHAPGNTVDSSGCEIHYSYGDNWCNLGPGKQVIEGNNAGFTLFLVQGATAYGKAICNGGGVIDWNSPDPGSSTSRVLNYPYCGVAGPYMSRCGANPVCGQ